MVKSLVGQPAQSYDLQDPAGQRFRDTDSPGHWQLLVFHRHLG